jgi:hypothetical protein
LRIAEEIDREIMSIPVPSEATVEGSVDDE